MVSSDNSLTLDRIFRKIEEGDRSLWNQRFGIGLDYDINEFSLSLERRGMLPTFPYDKGVEDLCAISIENDATRLNIADSRKQDRRNDSRFLELPDISESRDELKILLSKSYDIPADDTDAILRDDNIKIIDKITTLDMYMTKTWSVLSKFNDSKYISLNETTVLDNAFISNRNLNKLHRTRRLGEVLGLIFSGRLKNLRKEARPQLYYTTTGNRPDNNSYHKWNGLQVFDLDLKYADCFDKIKPAEVKKILFDALKKYPWLVGVGLSSSGNGIHIYTKIASPHTYWPDNLYQQEVYARYWYRMSYVQKYAAIRWVLENIAKVDNGSDPKHPVIDFAMAKISQGVRISYDADFLINHGFEDIQPIVGYHVPPVQGLSINDWLLADYVVENRTFQSWLNDNHITSEKLTGNYVEPKQITFEDTEVLAPETVVPYQGDINYQLRYNVCNTIAAFFGESGRRYAHIVLDSERCKNVRELDGIYTCSLYNDKTPTKYGLDILKKCGFHIALSEATAEALEEDIKRKVKQTIDQGVASAKESESCRLQLNSDEYLGDHYDELVNMFQCGAANLLVSPPGTGKTELVKKMSKTDRVLLVLPYISVIDAKVVKDNDLGENFDAYFGDAKVSDIKSGKSAVMTLDKFGRIDVDKIAYMFDYVMIDESHLIFTSSFRLEAMANSLKNIKQLMDMSKFDEYASKVVLMTGTPTGEIPYFEFYKRLNLIDVKKTESRTKSCEFILCTTPDDTLSKIAIHIAASINSGKKILYPTNNGDVQAAKLVGMIEHQLGRSVKWSYYKKSNSKSEVFEAINENATIGDYELVLASNYLSVGIDIKDMDDFECIYDNSFAGYEIEQFNCRLRKVDINSKVFISLYNASSELSPNLLDNHLFSIHMSREDRDLLRDFVDISKKKLELSLTYDPITNRIFTPGFRIENGAIVFKLEEHELVKFEERYLDCMRTPYFIAYQLSQYGYHVSVQESDNLDKKHIAELIKVGLENAKLESQIKNDIAINTFTWLIDNDLYINSYGMEYPNLVQRIWKDGIVIDEDPSLMTIKVEETLIGEVAKLTVPDRRIFDDQLSVATRFLSLYSHDTSKYIYNLCIREGSGKLNKSEIHRYMRLMKLVQMEERGQLSSEIYDTIKYIYSYVEKFREDRNLYIPKHEHETRINICTQIYLDSLGLHLRSAKMLQRYKDEIADLFNVLCYKTSNNDQVRLDYRIIPTPNNELKIKMQEYDSILKHMFNLSDEQMPSDIQSSIKDRHVSERNLEALNAAKQFRQDPSKLSELIVI